MPYTIPPEATMAAYGNLSTDAPVYSPLDTVTVTLQGRRSGDTVAHLRVCDPDQRPYYEADVPLVDNRAQTTFIAGGKAGAQYIYLSWPGEKRYSRYTNFTLRPETRIQSGDPQLDGLFPFTRDRMNLGRREYNTPRGKFVGYISADTWHFDGIWLRDWIYQLPAYRYWELDMVCGLDRFLEVQSDNGMIPDGIERDGRTWRVGLESDVEYIATLALWQTWQATGDDAWLEAALPRLERALQYIRSDPKHWDPEHQLIKRQHSCDTWDYDIDGATDAGTGRHVIATCDQSGYYLAFRAMSDMYAHLGKTEEARRWADRAEDYRKRAVGLLWDGTKFLHHAHLDQIDHGDFDESQQLAMGNTWAVTRGLPSPEQAASIVDEYHRRQALTGDAYPWWSLQPGYPDHLGYFKDAYRKQGGYANGGLMPWVGGELCLGAFLSGRERYGVELLHQWADHLSRTGGAHVWYWPNGEPGFRTTNEVPYAGWGMAQWISALVEGLAGIRDRSCLLQEVALSPNWVAADRDDVRCCAAYACSKAYFAYHMTLDRASQTLTLTCAGSAASAHFRLLLPEGWRPQTVTVNGNPVAFTLEPAGAAAPTHALFEAPVEGVAVVKVH